VILAFTGTRSGMTQEQRHTVFYLFPPFPDLALHGGARGADNDFDWWIITRGMPAERIEVYPTRAHYAYWAHLGVRTVHDPLPPLVRNRIMVERCDELLACPATAEEELRSGTWTTIRAARMVGKSIAIVAPDGSVRREPPA
jgi:hypothetical protein